MITQILNSSGEPDSKLDVVIIHGMFSGSSKLESFENALRRRRCYRRLHNMDIGSLRHLVVPKVLQQGSAEDHLLPEILGRIKARTLTVTFDIIGHSNGGYTALHLAGLLPAGSIRNVFTLATPAIGEPIHPNRKNFEHIVHITAGHDGVFGLVGSDTFDGPSRSTSIFNFPDEDHSSLHSEAARNGLDRLIALCAAPGSNSTFLDTRGILHIWPSCAEAKVGPRIISQSNIRKRDITICTGIHDEVFDKKCDQYIASGPIQKFVDFYYMYSHFLKERKELNRRISAETLCSKINKEELDRLRAESYDIEKILSNFNRKILEQQNSILSRQKLKSNEILSFMQLAIRLTESSGFGANNIPNLDELLYHAGSSYAEFNKMKSLFLPSPPKKIGA